MQKTRRSFLAASTGVGLSAAAIALPSVARANQTFNWKMTSAYPKGAPFYMDGPGSATDLAKRIAEMSNGRLRSRFLGPESSSRRLRGSMQCARAPLR